MGKLSFSNASVWVLAGGVAVVATFGCTAAIGAGVGVTMLGTAALTAGCYDPINVTVLDGVTGLPACDAKVVARNADGGETTFASCFYAELPVGSWTVLADRRGSQTSTAKVVVSRQRRCEPAVQTIELSLLPLGAAPVAPQPIRPRQPGEAPLTPGALPPPSSIGAETAAPPPAAGSSVAPNVSPPVAPATPAPVPAPPVPPAPGSPNGAGGAPAGVTPSAGAPSASPPTVSF